MSKEFILYESNESNFVTKFYRLMDLLVTNKSSSMIESMILMGIYYLQILSGFFEIQVGVLNVQDSNSDLYLNYISKIVRIKDLVTSTYSAYLGAIY